jgi:predicted SnoaL-like aldol condensation-catalyzing enzyme
MSTDYATMLQMTNRSIMMRLLKVLIQRGVTERADADELLTGAHQELMAHNTEVAAGAAQVVQMIRENLDKPV